jgi:hypothetical protein
LWDAILYSRTTGNSIPRAIGLPGLPSKPGNDLTCAEQNPDWARLLFSLKAALRWNSQGDQPAPARPGKARMTEPGWKHVLLKHVRDYAIFLLDREGNVRSRNNGAKAIKQYQANEIVGNPGAGTIFIVTLPPEAPSADEHNPQAQEAGRLGS